MDPIERLKQLEAELAAVKLQIAAEARAPGFKKAAAGDTYHRIYQDFDGSFKTSANTGAPAFSRRPLFGNKTQAMDFANAIQTILEMRIQPGMMVPEPHETSVVVIPQRNGTIKYQSSKCTDAIPSTIYARFKTVEAAKAAVAAVGETRVIAAAKTLAFFK
jgi:hypothetical protein